EQADLAGGGEDDTLNASQFSGPVTLNGAGGDDRLTGGPSNDRLLGGFDDDTLTGGAGNDTLDAAGGPFPPHDRLRPETGDFKFTVTSGPLAGRGPDSFSGFEGIVLPGGDGNNRLDASALGQRVSLDGGAGNDTLLGGSNDDTLDGGDGDDSLVGNNGS